LLPVITDLVARRVPSFLLVGKVKLKRPCAAVVEVAGYARLCHLEYRVADAVSITNTDLLIGKSFNREIFAELAETKITPTQKTFPLMIGFHLVDKHGALLSAVTSEVSLPVTINIELPHHAPPFDGKLPDLGSHSFAVASQFARKDEHSARGIGAWATSSGGRMIWRYWEVFRPIHWLISHAADARLRFLCQIAV
jgi:hypothetical protein